MTVIFNGRADAGATIDTYEWIEAARSDAITIVQAPDDSGQMFRFSSRESDDIVHGDWRAELSLSTLVAAPGREDWFYFDLWLDPAGLPGGMQDGLLFQMHSVDTGAESYGRQPPFALNVYQRQFLNVESRYDANETSTGSPQTVTSEVLASYPLKALFHRRVPVVIRIRWDYGSTGLLQLWADHHPVIDRVAPIGFNDTQGPYPKIGVAHCHHGNSVGSDNEVWVLNSGLKIGDSESSYYELTGRHPYPWAAARK